MTQTAPSLALVPMLTLTIPLALAACQSVGGASPEVAAAPSEPARPTAFIEAACGGCHAVEPPFQSPNELAPSFEHIANARGLDRESLAAWLTNAHNYPEQMDFDLTPERVEEVADYMITLQREDYEPTG